MYRRELVVGWGGGGGRGVGIEVYHEIFKIGSTHPGACGKISGLEGSHHRES
jgi:hypothetical protein